MSSKEYNSNDGYWSSCIRLVEKTFVPQIATGESRPYCEEDFKNYKATVNQNCQDILSILQHILDEYEATSKSLNSPTLNILKNYCIIMIGEHSQKNLWTTVESVEVCKQISEILCKLCSVDNLSQLLEQNDENVMRVITTLRPKLLKNTWKMHPAAVTCYKWFVSLLAKSVIINHLGDLIPTTLILLDDFEIHNQKVGLECLSQIVSHCYTEKQFVESGFAQMVLFNLDKFMYEKELNLITLYNCIEKILNSLETHNGNHNVFDWTERDNILEKLLNKMECEQNLQLRQQYMIILPKLLNSIGSSKWFKRVVCVLKGYCEHYGDFKTLKITLQSVKIILEQFQLRISAHVETLFTIFLKLYLDLIHDQTDDQSLVDDNFKNLEECIYLVCESSPATSKAIMQNKQIETLGFRSEFVNRLSEIAILL